MGWEVTGGRCPEWAVLGRPSLHAVVAMFSAILSGNHKGMRAIGTSRHRPTPAYLVYFTSRASPGGFGNALIIQGL
jgi:hypothetical protein